MTLPARSMNYDPLEAAEGDGPDDGRAPPYDTLSRAYPGLHHYIRSNLPEYLGDLGPCDVVGSSVGKSNLRANASAQKWVVAAHGETGPGCGVKVLMRCGNPGCRHEWMGDQTCKDRRCPKCGLTWAAYQGALSAWRMVEVGRTKSARGAWGRQAIVGAPRASWDTLIQEPRAQGALRPVVGALALAMGFRGFSLVFHPFRDSTEKGHYDIEGPHWHVIGWADKLADGGQIPERWAAYRAALDAAGGWERHSLKALPEALDDWIFHGVERAGGGAKRYQNWAQFYQALKYELSHAGIIDRAHAITYLGICHWRVNPMTKKERAARDAPGGTLCPKCGSPAFPVGERAPQESGAVILQQNLEGVPVPGPPRPGSTVAPRGSRWDARRGRYR